MTVTVVSASNRTPGPAKAASAGGSESQSHESRSVIRYLVSPSYSGSCPTIRRDAAAVIYPIIGSNMYKGLYTRRARRICAETAANAAAGAKVGCCWVSEDDELRRRKSSKGRR